MSGNGFFVGVAVAAYEWIAAHCIDYYCDLVYSDLSEEQDFHHAAFLKTRYNETVALNHGNILVVLICVCKPYFNIISWCSCYQWFVTGRSGMIIFIWIMIGLAVFAIIITLGGMKVIGFTDVIQVTVLIIGGLATAYMALTSW